MKAGTTIALLVVGALGIGVAVLAGRSGGKDACPRVVLTNDVMLANAQELAKVAQSATASMPARKLARRMYEAIFPHCDWSDSVDREIVDALGRSTTWQKMLAAVGDMTVADVLSNPAGINFEIFGGGIEGAATGEPTFAKVMGFG